MIRQLVALSCLLLASAVIITATDEALPSTQPIPLLLWAVADPAEDKEASKIDPVKFYQFYEDNLKLFGDYDARSDVVGVTRFLIEHSDESGCKGINWPAVLTKIAFKRTIGETEEKEHGLPSLVSWAMRNTGTGSSNPSIGRRTLIESILNHRNDILKLLYKGDVDGLIAYLDETKSESGTQSLDWKSVIENLKDNRQLFKYSCGLLKLQLCDRIKK